MATAMARAPARAPAPTRHFVPERQNLPPDDDRPMPPFDLRRIQEHVHGHLGWLAAIALVHPAVVLRRRSRRAHWAVGLSVAGVTAAAALGVAMYPAYREALRQPIFASSGVVGSLFERKEHLAFGAVALSWVGAITYAVAPRAEATVRDTLRRISHRAFVFAAALAVVAAALGTVVAAYRSF